MNKETSSSAKKVRKKKEEIDISMDRSLELYRKSFVDDVLPLDSNTDTDSAMRKKRNTEQTAAGSVSDKSPEKAPTTKNRKKEVREEEEKVIVLLFYNFCACMSKFMKFTNSRFNDFRQQNAEKGAVNSSLTEEITTLKLKLERPTSKKNERTKKRKRNSPPHDKEFEEECAGGSKNSCNSDGNKEYLQGDGSQSAPATEPIKDFSCKKCMCTTTDKIILHVHYKKHKKTTEEDPPASNVETLNPPEEISYKKCIYTTPNRKEYKRHKKCHKKTSEEDPPASNGKTPNQLEDFSCTKCTYTSSTRFTYESHVKFCVDKKYRAQDYKPNGEKSDGAAAFQKGATQILRQWSEMEVSEVDGPTIIDGNYLPYAIMQNVNNHDVTKTVPERALAYIDNAYHLRHGIVDFINKAHVNDEEYKAITALMSEFNFQDNNVIVEETLPRMLDDGYYLDDDFFKVVALFTGEDITIFKEPSNIDKIKYHARHVNFCSGDFVQMPRRSNSVKEIVEGCRSCKNDKGGWLLFMPESIHYQAIRKKCITTDKNMSIDVPLPEDEEEEEEEEVNKQELMTQFSFSTTRSMVKPANKKLNQWSEDNEAANRLCGLKRGSKNNKCFFILHVTAE